MVICTSIGPKPTTNFANQGRGTRRADLAMSKQASPNTKPLADAAGSLLGSTTPNSSRAQSPTPSATNSTTGRAMKASTSYGRFPMLMASGRSRASSSASQSEASPITAFPDETGASSSPGRTTPEQRRSGRAAASSLLAADARYKKYTQQVERALSTFESVNEWADFISFLSRLLKTLQATSPPYNEIPRKITVAKRLAQCLNPALPSGVHQRALEVYSHIFGLISEDGLRRDLQIWSSGLFPFFQFAATSVRPALIQIYETYYLPLGEDLRPAAKAFQLALLPGIEEETGDFFDRILRLLSRVSEAISQPFFLQTIFLILITTPSARMSALNYLIRRMPKPASNRDEMIGIYGPDLGLLVRAFGAAIEDDNTLVRRTAMDLLLANLSLDGQLMCSGLREDDKMLLMQTVTGIVLRKDLSLSRRLYSWLLGPTSSDESQNDYYNKYGLDLLTSSLLAQMQDASNQAEDLDRPYKILISLQDKTEIGDALMPRVLLVALSTLRQRGTSLGLEQTLTARLLLDASEPFTLWRLLHQATMSELDDATSQCQTIELSQWVATNSQSIDDEVRSLYAPLLFLSVLESLTTSSHDTRRLTRAFACLSSLLPVVNPACFAEGKAPLQSEANQVSACKVALELYDSRSHPPDDSMSHLFSSALSLLTSLLTTISGETNSLAHHGGAIAASCRLFVAVVLYGTPQLADDLTWPREAWLASSEAILRKAPSFAVVEAVIGAVVTTRAISHLRLIPEPNFDELVIDTLLSYLDPRLSLYHAHVVDMLWQYEKFAMAGSMMNLLCTRMTAIDTLQAERACQGFGILWRLTPDTYNPGERLFLPMNLILDSLQTSNPVHKRSAETWMRCNLKSYFRVLDPLLARLLRITQRQRSIGVQIHGKAFQVQVWDTKIDSSLVNKLLQNMLTLFQFGGQGLSRSCAGALLQSTSHPRLLAISQLQTYINESYLRAVSRLLLCFVECDSVGKDELLRNRLLQHTAVELLQVIVSRGNLDAGATRNIQRAIVSAMFRSIHRSELDLQPKQLHLLHSTLNASSVLLDSGSHSGSTSKLSSDIEGSPQLNFNAKAGEADSVDPLFVQLVIDGVGTKSNRPVLQHWIDFILMTSPCLQGPLQPVLLAIGDGIGDLLLAAIEEVAAYAQEHDPALADDLCEVTDVTTTMLLSAYEKLILLGIAKTSRRHSAEPAKGLGLDGGPGLFGYVSGVFTPDPGVVDEETPVPHNVGLTSLRDSIGVLLRTWLLSCTSVSGAGPSITATAEILERTRQKCRRVLERLFKSEPRQVFDSLMENWINLAPSQDGSFCDLIDALTPNAQRVVSLVASMIAGAQEKSRRTIQGSRQTRSVQAALPFLDLYFQRLEGPIAIQVWGVSIDLAKEVTALANSSVGRPLLLPALRCLASLGRVIAATGALEDRKYRRDLQETFVKLLEAVLANIAKIVDDGLWRRLAQRAVPAEKAQPSIVSGSTAFLEIHDVLAESVIPNLKAFLGDDDKVAAACTTIATHIALPALKQQKLGHAVEPVLLKLLLSLAKASPINKTWRNAVQDAFNDPRFFRVSRDVGMLWKPLLSSLLETDKDRLQEYIARIGATPSANIFTNREAEMVSRTTNLRRLSFIIYSSDRDHYLTQLPGIQEKLVDVLRTTVVSPVVHGEVYLCLRVLLCRLSAQYLVNFWPVILAELLRVFETTMEDIPVDGSDDLQLVLAACKFLDLLLVLQTEDFQIQQWLFVTDTTDAIYPPSEFFPEAIMDRLAEILSQHDHDQMSASRAFTLGSGDSPALRRPHLAGLHSINSIGELQAFFSHASLFSFEGVYAGAGVDWDAVEEGLAGDMFEMDLAVQ